jgi:AbrB family looped-hinge helix DNA binding protein
VRAKPSEQPSVASECGDSTGQGEEFPHDRAVGVRCLTPVPQWFTEWYDMNVSGTYTVTMGDRGRLVIPSELRERSGLKEGSPLILLETPGGLVLLTRSQLQERVRADLAGLDLVGELLAERRAEAAADDAE